MIEAAVAAALAVHGLAADRIEVRESAVGVECNGLFTAVSFARPSDTADAAGLIARIVAERHGVV